MRCFATGIKKKTPFGKWKWGGKTDVQNGRESRSVKQTLFEYLLDETGIVIHI